ncbi:bifunctional diaminohydroxyphosphoribosylaminopyrimidine deaminase/5-amino-6-(5-phosphoribosylamino)uracil reductase RibD [uncultured Fibrobacter sp.]|uniref:bifunctional diaminohydroxyphosphoribosylaminopyrimidine deaminase/5-amino-6-(5-phosphoribosylamino)uracil reductase RibD n=1 Tax=uncultured Fibrobacter sp. TaxID=261512 RepID=UPI002591FA27|nr:bifunctional diaminohydroxyphosphoribosylaminopyrimidine deaminase/5-amino-6-(5-phosphoribosylamino)uracil reductase RibD [uncultured Fibrobacter sp.]
MNYLEKAFEQALLAVGVSFPNPAVGAVVVKDGKIVGVGHTQRIHGPHAEVMALRDAGERANQATLYVTLEPCCHFGRTPPCTQAIIAAGIQKVFFAHRDPNPQVFGKSEKILASAGIESVFVSPPDDFLHFYDAYDFFVRNRRPFVELKIAESADGFIAAADRSPVRISGMEANVWTAKWRRTAECICVGGGTVLADNPKLTVRGVGGNHPIRIVFAGSRLLSRHLHLWETPFARLPMVYSRIPQTELDGLAEVRLLEGKTFAENWSKMMDDLSQMGIHRLVVEPGATLCRQILANKMWNRLFVLRSTKEMFNGLSWRSGVEPELRQIAKLGNDFLLTADRDENQ